MRFRVKASGWFHLKRMAAVYRLKWKTRRILTPGLTIEWKIAPRYRRDVARIS
jgi:hypothetical protein